MNKNSGCVYQDGYVDSETWLRYAWIRLSSCGHKDLPYRVKAWRFCTFQTKSHNMKALVILRHSWSPFLLLTCLYGKWTFVDLCAAFWSIFLQKYSSQITHTNHMTMTISGQILSWSDYCKIKENVNITLLDLCLFTFYSVHANESKWHCL